VRSGEHAAGASSPPSVVAGATLSLENDEQDAITHASPDAATAPTSDETMRPATQRYFFIAA
jgi:hypothetical protein